LFWLYCFPQVASETDYVEHILLIDTECTEAIVTDAPGETEGEEPGQLLHRNVLGVHDR